MPDSNNILHAVKGYQEALDQQQELLKTGTDFNEQKGVVANTIATLHPKRLLLKVVEIIEDTPSTKTLRFACEQGPLPPFQAGQYINLFVNIAGVETARPYAISSAPLVRDHYDLTVKRVEGGYVSHYLLDEVKVGDYMQSTGPMGTFYHNPIHHGEDLVFLAGGSGIAPAMSMIRSFDERNMPNKFHLVYASSYENDVIFREELQELNQRCDFLTVTEVISRPTESYQGLTGHLTADFLSNLLKLNEASVNNKMFYICGPTSFHDFCAEQLETLKVKPRRVRIECNGPPKHPETLAGWPEGLIASDQVRVTIRNQGSFMARVDEPLLNSMERNGYTTENACRSGECSLCRVKVMSGSVFNPDEAKLRSTDADYGWCHSCVAFPTSDVEIMI
ncbi:FAD-binding oxidoreductase [Aestuariirhabdus sp. Z084]|uniref:FAD-binding oxidoreductase n=1 Tax=Aestuariirhabdus haliotis TaxID=2918751 RepID=UPI00201B41B9|nr:FAD-binding oxidoreductase [Aestuariirhabdus haliotis]MCL6417751.1 FAD-binding oxidoreductase [Aestuariirhabdus haliotis]MCL6421690.1 FAD-binding oxidoreductase [Aestuariirhabdus haliotis]